MAETSLTRLFHTVVPCETIVPLNGCWRPTGSCATPVAHGSERRHAGTCGNTYPAFHLHVQGTLQPSQLEPKSTLDSTVVTGCALWPCTQLRCARHSAAARAGIRGWCVMLLKGAFAGMDLSRACGLMVLSRDGHGGGVPPERWW